MVTMPTRMGSLVLMITALVSCLVYTVVVTVLQRARGSTHEPAGILDPARIRRHPANRPPHRPGARHRGLPRGRLAGKTARGIPDPFPGVDQKSHRILRG